MNFWWWALLGLVVVLPRPLFRWGLSGFRRWGRGLRRRQLQGAALTYLHGLRGFLQAGVPFPTALEKLNGCLDSPFARETGKALARFHDGRPLSGCMDRLRARALPGEWGDGLVALEAAHREGLPLVPFLDHLLPQWSAQWEAELRARALLRSALLQGGVATAVGWGTGALIRAAGGGSGGWVDLCALGAVVLQGLGFWSLVRLCRF